MGTVLAPRRSSKSSPGAWELDAECFLLKTPDEERETGLLDREGIARKWDSRH